MSSSLNIRYIIATTALVGCLGVTVPSIAETYEAHLTSMNAANTGSAGKGEATFVVSGDKLVVHIKMDGVPANIEHWEHFHGFASAAEASCATPAMDANSDGLVDLLETEPVSGTTMVPFNDQPQDMVIPTHTYPHATDKGTFEYTKVVPLGRLEATFARVYSGGKIDLDKRVVYVHGVPEALQLPRSVGSLGPIPSHVTLPIACGEISRVAD